MSSNSITQLISLLTRPLIRTHAPTMVLSLQLYLQATFTSFTASTLTLCPSSPAPPQMHYACLASGVSWEDWIAALCPDGRAMQLLISQTAIHVRIPGSPGLLTIWRAKEDEHLTLVPISKTSTAFCSSFRARLQATLASARVRRRAEEVAPMAIRIPTLLQANDEDSDSESSESDSDSDSIFSFASRDSMSSATTTSSTPSHSAIAITLPHVDHTKKTVTNYMYEGGVTKVMTGGVMLGKPAAPVVPVAAKYVPPKPTLARKDPASRLRASSNADNWRRKVGATA